MRFVREQVLLMEGIAILGLFVVAYWARPLMLVADLPLCPLRILAGRPCLFCGLTHALAFATHGDFKRAAAYHPYWWVAALILLGLAALCLWDGLRGTHYCGILVKRSGKLWWVAVAIACGLTLARWVCGA